MTTSAIAPGQHLGGYVIEARLGAGGMGEVWRAWDPQLERRVALKILSGPESPDGTARARFLREGRAAASLVHPGIVTIFGAGEDAGFAYLVMELVEGNTLRAASSGADLAQRLRWLRDLAEALAAVHRAGFIHRDVKPGNVMVTRDGALKLLDFGIVRPAPEISQLTATGHVVGTPRYVAPEQWRGERVDPRIDQFAWGLVAFELLSGRHADDVSVGFGRLADWTAPARSVASLAKDVPAPVVEIVDRALARRPDERFANMEEIARRLSAILADGASVARAPEPTSPGAPVAAPPPRRTGGARAGIFLAGVLVALLAGLVTLAIVLVRGDRFSRAVTPSRVEPADASSAVTSEEPDASPVVTLAGEPDASADVTPPPPAPPPPAARRTTATSAASRAPAAKECVPFSRVVVDTSGLADQIREGARLAWQRSVATPLLACLTATERPPCSGDVIRVRVRVGRLAPRLEVGPTSMYSVKASTTPSTACLNDALRWELPYPIPDNAIGWVEIQPAP